MAVMRVAGIVLEHILDLPEDVEITDIEREFTPAGEPTKFIFHLEGADPGTGEELIGELAAIYSEDDEGVHFEGFDRVE